MTIYNQDMKRWLIVVLPILFLAILISRMVPKMIQSAHNSSEDSSRRALFVQVESDLMQHRAEHGKFPTSLPQLAITAYPDGSSPQTLKHFTYSSNGPCYEMSVPLTDKKTILEAGWQRSSCE